MVAFDALHGCFRGTAWLLSTDCRAASMRMQGRWHGICPTFLLPDAAVEPVGAGEPAMKFKLLIAFERVGLSRLLGKAQQIKVALNSEPALTLLPDPWPACYPSRAALTQA